MKRTQTMYNGVVEFLNQQLNFQEHVEKNQNAQVDSNELNLLNMLKNKKKNWVHRCNVSFFNKKEERE